ncbi:hypothetical protein AVEN_229281-1, partial [Araneus ventricosus]
DQRISASRTSFFSTYDEIDSEFVAMSDWVSAEVVGAFVDEVDGAFVDEVDGAFVDEVDGAFADDLDEKSRLVNVQD